MRARSVRKCVWRRFSFIFKFFLSASYFFSGIHFAKKTVAAYGESCLKFALIHLSSRGIWSRFWPFSISDQVEISRVRIPEKITTYLSNWNLYRKRAKYDTVISEVKNESPSSSLNLVWAHDETLINGQLQITIIFTGSLYLTVRLFDMIGNCRTKFWLHLCVGFSIFVLIFFIGVDTWKHQTIKSK